MRLWKNLKSFRKSKSMQSNQRKSLTLLRAGRRQGLQFIKSRRSTSLLSWSTEPTLSREAAASTPKPPWNSQRSRKSEEKRSKACSHSNYLPRRRMCGPGTWIRRHRVCTRWRRVTPLAWTRVRWGRTHSTSPTTSSSRSTLTC